MSRETASNAGKPKARVLIVEPERAYLGVLARRIAELGYKVATGDGTHQAIAEFYRRAPDLILTELKGREFHCGELIGMVRRDPVNCDIPILVLNGKSETQASAAIMRSGADAVVHKPFHFEYLAARIERELQRKRSLDDLRTMNLALDARIAERAIAIGELKERIAVLSAERLSLARAPRD